MLFMKIGGSRQMSYPNYPPESSPAGQFGPMRQQQQSYGHHPPPPPPHQFSNNSSLNTDDIDKLESLIDASNKQQQSMGNNGSFDNNTSFNQTNGMMRNSRSMHHSMYPNMSFSGPNNSQQSVVVAADDADMLLTQLEQVFNVPPQSTVNQQQPGFVTQNSSSSSQMISILTDDVDLTVEMTTNTTASPGSGQFYNQPMVNNKPHHQQYQPQPMGMNNNIYNQQMIQPQIPHNRQNPLPPSHRPVSAKNSLGSEENEDDKKKKIEAISKTLQTDLMESFKASLSPATSSIKSPANSSYIPNLSIETAGSSMHASSSGSPGNFSTAASMSPNVSQISPQQQQQHNGVDMQFRPRGLYQDGMMMNQMGYQAQQPSQPMNTGNPYSQQFAPNYQQQRKPGVGQMFNNSNNSSNVEVITPTSGGVEQNAVRNRLKETIHSRKASIVATNAGQMPLVSGGGGTSPNGEPGGLVPAGGNMMIMNNEPPPSVGNPMMMQQQQYMNQPSGSLAFYIILT
jgi:hypothetical protein